MKCKKRLSKTQSEKKQTNEYHYHPSWRWRIIVCALLLQGITLTLAMMILRVPGVTLPEGLSDHIVTTLLASFFSLVGIVIFVWIFCMWLSHFLPVKYQLFSWERSGDELALHHCAWAGSYICLPVCSP
jgi:hypothetical protein